MLSILILLLSYTFYTKGEKVCVFETWAHLLKTSGIDSYLTACTLVYHPVGFFGASH